MSIKSTLEGIAGWFQPAYDRIKAWKLPPEIDEAFDAIWEQLPGKLKDGLWQMLKKAYDTYGEEFAKALLAAVIAYIQDYLSHLGEDD